MGLTYSKKTHKVGGKFNLDQSWTPARDEEMFGVKSGASDALLFYSYSIPKFFGIEKYLKPDFKQSVFFPNSEESRRDSKLYKLKVDLGLGGAVEDFSYKYTFTGNYKRHKYQTKSKYAGSDYLSDYDQRHSITLGY